MPKIVGQGIPFQVGFVYLPLALVLSFVLVKTVSGRYLLGVGTNALAARFSAIDVWGVRFWAYVAAGFICGLAAVVQTGLSASATPDVGSTMNLAAITIAVLGGVSIIGGEGDVLGILLASLIVIFLYNGIGLALGALRASGSPSVWACCSSAARCSTSRCAAVSRYARNRA